MRAFVHALALPLIAMCTVACGGATSGDSGGVDGLGVGGDASGGGGGGATGGGAGQETGSGGGEPDPGTGGAARGGAAQGGAAQGGAAQGGSAGAGACCLAAAVCGPGETEIDGPGACPDGADCYSSSICCSTVWCARLPVACDAYPVCDRGDIEVSRCAADAPCYERTLCGTTILCASPTDGGAGCDPTTEYNRDYVGTPETCQLIDYLCASPTTPFQNACGCGCEQDASCPEWVDCMPGPQPNPQCSDAFLAACPFTQIAF